MATLPKTLSTYILSTLLLTIYFVDKINGYELSRKLDDPSLKCGGCSPCGHPSCYQSPPPPPPPPPPKKPPRPYCPPPPSPPDWSYVPGTPGLYPVDPNYSYYSGASIMNLAATSKTLVVYGLLQLVIMWV